MDEILREFDLLCILPKCLFYKYINFLPRKNGFLQIFGINNLSLNFELYCYFINCTILYTNK